MPRLMPSLQYLGVGDEHVVADQLDGLAEAVGQDLPAVPVVLAHAVLDADDGVLVHPGGIQVDHLRRGQRQLVRLQVIFAVLVEFGCGRIHADRDILARHIACRLDGFDDDLQRRLVGTQRGCETAFVADGGRQAALVQHRLQRVEHFRAAAQRFAETLRRRPG